ncbi:UNVERIFIED_CONTAM: MarR family transcriptional regulator [Halobacillus marinus]|uniref:MarR family winged helix-turn-helix transcriptional regulator n=1 Tax=Bacillaceae TaxID=186817 RepID=UPI0002A4E23B|nr:MULTISPECIES: MarR family transcriptional regulator [Bacillaceae]ELK47420.1 transcriptional regulator [Halobacillus sp. BAB-2008]QHT48266.1 winged helix DNA-binding protein [Bacillus sp. SB49]
MSLIFHHIQQLSRNVNQYLNEALKEEEIYMSHWAVLFQLYSNGGVMTQSVLRERLNIEAPPLSRVIVKLESLGYVSKGPSEDQRTNDITLTEAGTKAFPRWQQAIQDSEERLLKELGADNERDLESLIKHLSDIISKERRKSN